MGRPRCHHLNFSGEEILMKKALPIVIAFIFAVSILSVVFLPTNAQAATDNEQACWGQASAAFAQAGRMGYHASNQEVPRAGLANLAQILYDDGVIDAPTLQALGEWLVSIDPDLTVEACM